MPETEAPNATHAKIGLKGGVLTLRCNLQRADQHAFQEACTRLCRCTTTQAVIDLTKCTYMNSMLIGVLVDTVTELKLQKRDVIVNVSPEIGKFLHMAHLYHIFDYKIVEPMAG